VNHTIQGLVLKRKNKGKIKKKMLVVRWEKKIKKKLLDSLPVILKYLIRFKIVFIKKIRLFRTNFLL